MRILFVLFILLATISLQAQQLPASLQLKVDLVYLASDFLEGRETGTRGEALAAEYLAGRLAEMGIPGAAADGSYFQPFSFVYKPNPHLEDGIEKIGRNVIGFIDNGQKYTVAIGAHYDHLGYGQFNSRYTGKPAIHNGADDNASGVAGVLYLAQRLKDMENPGYNFLIMGFSGEELGLFGSKYYVNNPIVPLENMAFMLNMDMTGRLNGDKVLIVNGVGTSPAWEKAISGANSKDLP